MAVKTNFEVNGQEYYRLTKTVGRKFNKAGKIVPERKQFLGKSKKEAEKKYEEFMAKRRQGKKKEKKYFGIIAEDYIYNFLANDNRLKDRSKDLYIKQWNRYIKPSDLYSMPLDEITATTIQEVYNTMDGPESAVKAVHKTMRRFYKFLDKEGFAKDITGSLIIPKKGGNHGLEIEDPDSTEIVIWTDEEIKIILNGFSKADPRFRLRFLIVLAYYTGCRISELLAVKYSDFTANGLRIYKQVTKRPHFEQGKKTTYTIDLDTTKTESSIRTIPLCPEVLNELMLHKKWHLEDMATNGYSTDFVFTTNSGTLCDYQNVARACDRYYKKLNVPAKGFHTWRHTFATKLCEKGIPIQVTAELMGHADINITRKYYVNISDSEKEKAVSVLSGIMNTQI